MTLLWLLGVATDVGWWLCLDRPNLGIVASTGSLTGALVSYFAILWLKAGEEGL